MRHGGGDLCGHPHRHLGGQVRRPGGDYVRQGDAVHLPGLVHPLQEAGHHPHNTSAYHPQSNGLVERAHRQLKEGLKTRLASHEWPAHLPWVLLGMRSSPKDDSAISSAELVYGAPLVLPGEFVDAAEPPAADFWSTCGPARFLSLPDPSAAPPQETNQLLQQAKWVYIRRGGTLPPLTPPYAGPYAVAEAGEKSLRGAGGRAMAADLSGPPQAAHWASTRDGGAAHPPWSAAEGEDRSGGRNDPHLRGSCCWRGSL
jgi:hypothetical protein